MDPLDNLDFLRNSYPDFARECLRIRMKDETIGPFILNDAQMVAHQKLEEQKARLGFIRALILKGRQQGISTYIGGRYYHRASMRKGVNVYILAHEQPASDTLFGMVDRYQRLNPLAPHVGVSNIKELVFDRLDSSYAVATAGTKAGGRSKATSLFHGSEVAFWANAPDHFAASIQAVPLAPNTEIILESTSAGAGGEFYERWQDAEAGRGDYIAIFLPWWLSKEYARDPEYGFQLAREADEGEMSEYEYAETYKLTNRQMAWRRAKIIELRSLTLFQREYPADPSEAWTAPPGHEPFIAALYVMRARKRVQEGAGPLIIGVDPASGGGDRFSMAARRGFQVPWVKYRSKINSLEGTQWCMSVIDELRPARMNIDAGNIGAAIITNLKNAGPKYAEIVRGVNFGGVSESRLSRPKVPGPWNRRAEMWMRMRDWLQSVEGASLPDDSAIQSDLCAPRLKPRLDNFTLLESKEQMKTRGVRSPDMGDSIALTFAFLEYLENWHEPAKVQTYGEPDRQPAPAYPSLGDLSGHPQSWMG